MIETRLLRAAVHVVASVAAGFVATAAGIVVSAAVPGRDVFALALPFVVGAGVAVAAGLWVAGMVSRVPRSTNSQPGDPS